MGQLGDLLRKTRESKGLTLQQVEDETNMRWKYIEALEMENYDIIPGKAYVKGFLRNYAAFLELEPDEVLEQYQLINEKVKVVVAPEQATPKSKRKTPKRRINFSRLILAGLSVLVVAGLVWGGSVLLFGKTAKTPETANQAPAGQTKTQQGKTQKPTTQQPTTQQPSPATGQTTPQVQPLPGTGNVPAAPVDVTLKAAGGQCWLRVVSDGKQVYQGMLGAGQSMNFKGNQSISVRFGNAGAVQVIKNGANLGFAGRTGEVFTREFTK